RRQDPERGPESGRLVDERGAGTNAGSVRLACHAHDPADRLHQRVVAPLLPQRPHRPERADRAVDEPRVPAAHHLVTQATCLREPRPQALDEDIRCEVVRDRKSTRLNSSHRTTSYAVFCLEKKKGRAGRSAAAGRSRRRSAADSRQSHARPPALPAGVSPPPYYLVPSPPPSAYASPLPAAA